jgi:hypothetical protein
VTDAPPHRFPWRVTALVVLIVAAASVVAGLLLARDRVGSAQPPPVQPTPSVAAPSALPLEEQRQVTLLLTVRDDERLAVSSILIGVGGGTDVVSELLLPRDLLLPTSPPMRLADVDDPTGPRTAEQPLETLLGVQVDATVDLDRLAWAGLIDATGSRVDAAAAEQPGSFALVLDRVLKGLPYDEQTVGELLTGLGSMARLTVTNEDASLLLSLIGRGLRGDGVRREVLPVTYVRAGPARAAVTDLGAADAMVRDLFPEALLRPGHSGATRVVVQRAGATLGAQTVARIALAGAGFGVVADAAAQEPVTATSILVPEDTEAARARGTDVAVALGLDPSAVSVDPAPEATVDVRVRLGADVNQPAAP